MNDINNNKILSCAEINQSDIVDYLSAIGYLPAKIQGNNYWYLSPFRDEKTASFKVNRKLNRWWDFGTGQGKTLVDFGILFHNCTIKELMVRLSEHSFEPTNVPPKLITTEQITDCAIYNIKIFPIGSSALIRYLQERRIPLSVAHLYCGQANYSVKQREYTAISFKNIAGGYELRNKYFKGSNSPKAISFINNQNSKELCVFEGFFDFLTYCVIFYNSSAELPDFLILNSLSFFSSSITRMIKYKKVNLFLDNDVSGKKCTQKVLQLSDAFIDQSALYEGHTDLNSWLCGAKNI